MNEQLEMHEIRYDSIIVNTNKQTLKSYSATRERVREKKVFPIFLFTQNFQLLLNKKAQNTDDNTCENARYV